MVAVYFSHAGEVLTNFVEVQPGQLKDIIHQLEIQQPDIHDQILDPTQQYLNSSVLIFKNIIVEDDRFLESDQTVQIKSLAEEITDQDKNIFIAIFHPEKIMAFLRQALSKTDKQFHFANYEKEYKAYLSTPEDTRIGQPLFVQTAPEPLYPFTSGRLISELTTTDLIDVQHGKIIPAALTSAIAHVWEIDTDFRLRLFQEEALQHIVTQLSYNNSGQSQPLLLSIPTGGGKTEAFLIPLIAHLYNQKEQLLQAGTIPQAKVRSLVIYPMRALATDQARRIAEILYQMNEYAIEDRKITVGVLTGDTPPSNYNVQTEKSLLQLCPRCSAVLTQFPEKTLPQSGQPMIIAQCTCGAEIDYFRLTRQDILNQPPDLLITSPDMINRMLQSPRYHDRIFSSAIDLVVFDEIHLYESIFGCNVAHLLRRFEEACGKKPLYVGASATIRNAKELACLIFDADIQAVKYLRPQLPDEEETTEKRPYLDYNQPPTRYRYHYAAAPARKEKQRRQKVVTAIVNTTDALGHIIRDPHFRKTLIFSNFRHDTDNVVRYLRDQEDRYYSPYHQKLFPKLVGASKASPTTQLNLFTKTEIDIILAIDYWYQLAKEKNILYGADLEIGWHRGGLERDERIKAVNRFSATRRLTTHNENRAELPIDIMVATSTLEVGIDIGDVTTVINHNAPFTANEYTQRVGRGGRRKDSLALTIVDPHNPLDFYFLKNFEHYAHPTTEDYEDAPIIISNEMVFKSHLFARLLDWLAHEVSDNTKEETQAQDLLTATFAQSHTATTFEQDWKQVSEHLFARIFTPERIEQLTTWLQREAQLIPDIHPTQLNIEQLHEWWQTKCAQLYKNMSGADRNIQITDYLSGMSAKDRELVPNLRSSGPSVGLYLVREGKDDELKDTLPRKQAISSHPLGGYASQGSVTFKVEGIKEEDYDAEEQVKKLFLDAIEGQKALRYFHYMFGENDNQSPFPNDLMQFLTKVQIQTPKDLSVKYSPYRFYCPHCKATYGNKAAGDERCPNCHAELRQLTEIYICGGCGNIYMPPVPKVCINPDCIAKTTSKKDQSPFFPSAYKQIGQYDNHNKYFRFRALPMLTWQCKNCGTEINYHAYHQIDKHILKQLDSASFNMNTPANMAKTFLHRPESWLGKNYQQNGFHPARFNCKQCKDAHNYSRISVKNIPSFRSIVHEYVIKQRALTPELHWILGVLDFQQVSVIDLARELYRRFYSPAESDTKITIEPIFARNNLYLANTYKTHAVFFRFNTMLDTFLTMTPYEKEDNVASNNHFSSPIEESEQTIPDDEEGDNTKPMPALLSWEKGRKPDPRRKWCRVVQQIEPGKTCPGPDTLCATCPYFDRQQHQRYLILHTLEHAIISAMPKYTGINKNQVRGLIQPNDEQEYDLALLDSTEGGSGSFYLLRKNWEPIWAMVGELLESAQDEGEQLALPYTCSRYNRDLSPKLAYAFYQYVQQQQKRGQ